MALDGGRLRGKALMALDAHGADRVLVPIGADRLAVVRADAQGVAITRLATIDATRCTAELLFDGAAPEAVLDGAARPRSRARSTRAGSRSPPTRSAPASR